jgi:hypothetical protein
MWFFIHYLTVLAATQASLHATSTSSESPRYVDIKITLLNSHNLVCMAYFAFLRVSLTTTSSIPQVQKYKIYCHQGILPSYV